MSAPHITPQHTVGITIARAYGTSFTQPAKRRVGAVETPPTAPHQQKASGQRQGKSTIVSGGTGITTTVGRITRGMFNKCTRLLHVPRATEFSVNSIVTYVPFPVINVAVAVSIRRCCNGCSLTNILATVRTVTLTISDPLLNGLISGFNRQRISVPAVLI